MNQTQRIACKLEDVAGNSHPITEYQTFPRECDAVQFGAEPATIGEKIIVAIAFDHGMNA